MTILIILMDIGDFVPRRPDWGSVEFASPLAKFIFGAFMAGIVIYAAFKALGHLGALAGADSTHKAKEAGMGLAFALAAVAIVYLFFDLFSGIIASVVK